MGGEVAQAGGKAGLEVGGGEVDAEIQVDDVLLGIVGGIKAFVAFAVARRWRGS